MRRTVLASSAMALVYLGSIGHFSACGQIGGSGSSTRPSAPRTTTPGSTLPGSTAPGSTTPGTSGTSPSSRFGSGALGGSTGPASGGTFVPSSDTPPTTIPPGTTPPPVRAPGVLDSTVPGTGAAADAGGIPRFGSPPASDRSLPPSTLPGSAPSTLDDPAFAPVDPATPDSRFNPSTDPLDDGSLRPSGSGAMPLDDERMLPGDPNVGRGTPGASALPTPGAEATPADRRLAKMIYRNELATFFLVLNQGSAYYHLQQQRGAQSLPQPQACANGNCEIGSSAMPSYAPHLATLRLEESNDGNYWHYTAQDGDQFTVEWAFAKRPSRDGGYAIYRQTRDGWARYGSFSRQLLR